jgi:hypothetical protein
MLVWFDLLYIFLRTNHKLYIFFYGLFTLHFLLLDKIGLYEKKFLNYWIDMPD